MSNSVLFGNNTPRNTVKNLVEFKAGKMTVKGKMVYPDTRKGQLYVYQSDDSLMHFCWKDRTTGVVEDDLIIFPDDCEFKHVSQCKSGRVYLLKFKSSSRKFFFWLQDLKTDKDEEYCKKINEVLNNPPAPGSQRNNGGNQEGDLQNLLNNMSQQQLMQLFGGVGQIGGLGSLLGSMNRPFSGNRISLTSSVNSATNSQSRSLSTNLSVPNVSPMTSDVSKSSGTKPSQSSKSTVPKENNQIRLSDLQNFLSGLPMASNAETLIQRDVINELSASIPAAILPTESLEVALSAYLPTGDSLSITLSSPQFSQALSMFWSAFQSGQVAPVIQQFGLDNQVVNAATTGNIEDFINALEAELKNQTSHTDTDISDSQNVFSNSSGQTTNHEKIGSIDGDKKNDDDEGMNLD